MNAAAFRTIRPLAWATLVLAFFQIVFGAIVRITGSGMGCGDHWPKCHGMWFPPLDRMDLVIEVFHRYIAAGLIVTMLALLATSFMRRREPGVGGRGGVLGPVLLAVALVIAVALFGAVTVIFELPPLAVIGHKVLAILMLAVLVVALIRSGGLAAARAALEGSSRRTRSATMAAVVIAFLVILLGGFTANVPGAAPACQGFPLCNGSFIPRGGLEHIHFTHRLLAYALFFHVLGMVIGVTRRGESPVLVRAAWTAFAAIVAQVLIAAALVEMFLPPVLQSLHQAVGTFVWIALVAFAALAWRRAGQPGVSGGDLAAADAAARNRQSMAVFMARGADH